MQRWLFRKELERVAATAAGVYYLDESGIDHRLHRPYARAPRGEKRYADIHGGRRGRTSIISASRGGKLVSPVTFEGYCDGDMVCGYFAQTLLPSIPRGSAIVLDNAAFHRSPSLQELVESSGCSLMFLPAYSPDLNPIEHVWATLKKGLIEGIEDAENKMEFIDKACLSLCA